MGTAPPFSFLITKQHERKQPMSKPFAPYLVARQHGTDIEWPVLEVEGGQKAILCFTEASDAQEYLKGHDGQALGWSVVQIKCEEFLRWLRSNLLKGVTLLVIDPKSNENHGRALPLFQVLVAVEGGVLGIPPAALGERHDVETTD
jgi:hypothetical protein